MAKEKTRQELLKEIVDLRASLGDAEFRINQEINGRNLEEIQLHSEERLEAHKTLTTVLDSIDAHVYVADMESSEILYMNQNMQKDFGDDLTGQICYKVFWGEEGPCEQCTNALLLDDDGEPANVHIWEGQNPITKRTYINRDRAILWHDGRLVRIQVATDITERRQVENALRESEARYRTISEITSDYAYSFRIGPDGELIRDWVTGALTKITGYTADELRELGDWDAIIHPDDLAIPYGQVDSLLAGKTRTVEYRLIKKDGSTCLIRDFGRPEVNEDGSRVTHIYGTIQDITEQVSAEKALRESEEKYRQLFELESDAIFLIENKTSQILEVNSIASELYGYSREELLAMKNTDLSAEPDETRRVTKSSPIRKDDVVIIPHRLHRKKDGTVIDVEISGRFFVWQDMEVHVAAIRDITARIQAEQVLLDDEARYRTLFTESPIVLWEEDFSEVKKYIENLRADEVTNLQKYFDENPSAIEECLQRIKILNVNMAALGFYEASSTEELLGSFDKLFVEESYKILQDELVTFASGRTLFESEIKAVTLTGKIRNAMIRVTIPPGYIDTWEKVFVSVLDISERIETEKIIKASEARFRSLFYDSPLELWELDYTDIKAYIDELKDQGVTDFLDYYVENPDEVLKCYNLMKVIDVNQAALDLYAASNLEELIKIMNKILVPESLVLFKDRLVGLAEGNSTFNGEVIYQNLNGELLHSMAKVNIPPGYEANWERVYISSMDITVQKQAEEMLKRRAQEMATLHAVTLDLATPEDLESMLVSIVARATELLDGSSGGLYLCDEEKREARCVVSYNTAHDFTGIVLKYGEGAAGIVSETGKPLIIEDYHAWEGRGDVYEGDESLQAILSVPIVWQEQLQGVLHVLSDFEERKFGQDDLDLLMILANHAAIAMENIRLLQQIQRHADELEERVTERTQDLRTMVTAMAGREVRMAELKKVITKLHHQIESAGMTPIADDPLNELLA